MNDTAPELRARYLELQRAQSLAQRAATVGRLWRGVRIAAEAGVRLREPGLSEAEVRRRVLEILYGVAYTRRVLKRG